MGTSRSDAASVTSLVFGLGPGLVALIVLAIVCAVLCTVGISAQNKTYVTTFQHHYAMR
jgi:hypothetical protein